VDRKQEFSEGDDVRISQGTETILLVEDEHMVRNLLREMLESCGYQVLAAEDGRDALSIWESYQEPIHLLITDVVMPGMSGRELADRLAAQHSKMKVLYMSGYTDDVIVHRGVLDEGMNFIQKPFALEMLVRKVRAILSDPGPEQSR
jgi:DNA-binding response OmpR family regulator